MGGSQARGPLSTVDFCADPSARVAEHGHGRDVIDLPFSVSSVQRAALSTPRTGPACPCAPTARLVAAERSAASEAGGGVIRDAHTGNPSDADDSDRGSDEVRISGRAAALRLDEAELVAVDIGEHDRTGAGVADFEARGAEREEVIERGLRAGS